MLVLASVLIFGAAFAACAPADPIISKLEPERYHYVIDGEGNLHLADLWMKASSLAESARFSPDNDNVYHLFTRQNPSVSQPIVPNNDNQWRTTNFNANRITVLIIHGWRSSATSAINTVLVHAYLVVDDVNVIVVDWSVGARPIDYTAAVNNAITSGHAVARFVNWLNDVSGTDPSWYHIIGHSLGAQQAGIVGRNVNGNVSYITALDPAKPGFITNDNRFRRTDADYTEVIHTEVLVSSFINPLGDVDFYPNGGFNMPGCNSLECDHSRSYYYMAESILSGGFTGRRCNNVLEAMSGNCNDSWFLQMGGRSPKTGQSGIFHLETNAGPPFSIY